MSKSFQTGAGNKVKLFVALLPLGDRTEPVDVSIIAGAGIGSGATTFNVTALTGPIAGGTPLLFTNGGGSTLTVYLTDDAKTGDTNLKVETTTAALAGSSTASYVAKQRLLGGTKTGATIGADVQESLVFEDELGYSDGVVTKQSWEVPWTANLLSNDDCYRRVYYAATHGIAGREVYVWQQDPAPKGAFTAGDGLKGSCVVTNFQKDLPSDNITTFTCTFKGQGSPTITRYS